MPGVFVLHDRFSVAQGIEEILLIIAGSDETE